MPIRTRDSRLTISPFCHGLLAGVYAEQDSKGVIGSAILDRILHHVTTISIRGDLYRRKDKLKSGVVTPTTA